MSDLFRSHWPESDQPSQDAPIWHPSLAVVWSWVEVVLEETPTSAVAKELLCRLCGVARDVYAPAMVIQAQDAGIALDRLLAARMSEAYGARFGVPRDGYEIARLRAIVRPFIERG